MLEDRHDQVVLAIGSILLGIHVVKFVWQSDVRRLCPAVCSAGARLRGLAKAALRRRPADSGSLAAEAERLVTERRTKLARSVYRVVTTCMQVCLVGVILNLLTDTPRFLTEGLDIIFLFIFALLTLLKSRLERMQSLELDCWYSFFMSLTVLAVTPVAVYKEVLPVMSQAIMVLRLLGGLTCLNIPLAFFWNFVYLLVVSGSYIFGQSHCIVYTLPSTFIATEFISLLHLILFLSSVKGAMSAQAWQELEAQSARDESSAVIGLLKTMSDAVVELDAELRIVQDSPQLATMLLHGQGRSKAGMQFAQLLASDDDRERFHAHMANHVTGVESLADVFHVRMHDSLRNSISVEVFHVCKPRDRKGDHHLIGIREDLDRDGSTSEKAKRVQMRLRGNDLLGTPRPASPQQVSAGHSDEAVVTFDAMSFQVMDVSSAFTARCGRCQDETRFDEWVPQRCREQFLRIYQEFFNQWTDSGEATSSAVFRNLPLRVPMPSSSVCLQATVTITLKMIDDTNEGWAVSEARVTDLSNMQLSRRRRSNRVRSLLGGVSP